MGIKGGCCSQMSSEAVRVTEQMLANLPSDGHRLPPNGRRLLIQLTEKSPADARVFDLAFLPDKILEILRITKSRIRTYVPSFAPERTISEPLPFDLKGFAIASDARYTVSTRGSDALLVTRFPNDKKTAREIESVPLPPNAHVPAGLTLSPDNSTLIAAGYGHIVFYNTQSWRVTNRIKARMVDRKYPNYTRHHFIDGGKYLLFEAGDFGMRVFDTSTWNEVGKPRSIRGDAISYYDTPDSRRALFQVVDKLFLKSGSSSTELLTLGEDTFEKMSFSPDGTRVAVVTSGLLRAGDNTWRHVRIRVWDASSARLVHELRPYEKESCESVDGLDWTPDGKYFLAATKSDSFFSNRNISVWDASSGRHVGELEGCVGEIFGMRLLSGGDKIAAGCADNRILIWDLAALLAEIERFRKGGVAR